MQTSSDIDQQVGDMNDSVDYYWHTNTKRAILLADEAYNLLDLLTDPSTKAQTIANKGVVAYTLGDFGAAIKLYDRAMKLASQNDLPITEYLGYYLILLQKQGLSMKVLRLSDSLIATGFESKDLSHKRGTALIELHRLAEFDSLLNQVKGQENPVWFILIAEKFKLLNQYDSALYYLNRKSELTPDSEVLEHADIKKRKSQNYLLIGQFDKALIELDSALKIYESSDFLYGKAEILHELGNLYGWIGDFEKSIDYYYASREIFEELNSLRNVAQSYLELGWMHFNIDNNKSKELIDRAIEIAKKIINPDVLGKSYNYLGTYYGYVGNYDSAIYCYENALEICQTLQDRRGEEIAKFNLASIYEKQGYLRQALNLYRQSITDENHLIGVAINYYTMGQLYTKLNNYDSAGLYLYKAKSLLKEIKESSDYTALLLYLSQYHERLNDTDSALFYYKQHMVNKIELLDAERNSRMAEMEVRFEIDQKNQKIKLLNLENENRKQQIKIGERTISNQQFLIILISVIVVSLMVVGIVILLLYRNKTKVNRRLEKLMSELQEKTEEITAQSEELQEANEEISSLNEGLESMVDQRTKELKDAHRDLDTFFYRASHDFRSPLTTFQGLIGLARHSVRDEDMLDILRRMDETFQRFSLMINKLRDISTINVEEVKFKEIYLNEFFTKIEQDNQEVLTNESIDFNYSGVVDKINTNERIFYIVMNNLIENAIVFMDKKSPNQITVSAYDKETFYEIVVHDTGIGFPENIKSRVYDLYFRGSALSKGNGLGLYICRKGVEKINASIDFESELGVGTSFYIRIKKN